MGLSAVVRQDVAGRDADAPTPALFADYIVYRPANLTIKGSVARNHHFASLNDLYFLPGGNPDLKAEHGWSYDIDLDVKSLRRKHQHHRIGQLA